MAIRFIVNTKDKGLVSLETFPCRTWVKELCENREFESFEQLQTILRVVDVSKEAYERGLGCPADAHRAIKLIESFPKFKFSTAVITSKESGMAVYMMCKEFAKQGKILHWGRIEEPQKDGDPWTAEVITSLWMSAPDIPDNATVGDVIKAMFPDVKWFVNEDNEVFTDHKTKNSTVIRIDLNTWNAPYRRAVK